LLVSVESEASKVVAPEPVESAVSSAGAKPLLSLAGAVVLMGATLPALESSLSDAKPGNPAMRAAAPMTPAKVAPEMIASRESKVGASGDDIWKCGTQA
jgi:hypothetical protein